jgi:hypothetical protein
MPGWERPGHHTPWGQSTAKNSVARQWDESDWVDQINELKSNTEFAPAYRGLAKFPVG